MQSLVLLSALYRSRQNFALSHRTSEHMGALAMSESEAGSDVVNMRIKAEKKDTDI